MVMRYTNLGNVTANVRSLAFARDDASCARRTDFACTTSNALSVILSRKDGEGPRKFSCRQASVFLRDQINQREVPRFARDDKPVLRSTHEIFLAGEARAVFLFVV